jgi:hypothetical protein
MLKPMPRQILGRLAAAADLLRPRTFFRTLSRVDTIADKTRELSAAVDTLRIQSEQLLTIQRVDWEKRFDLARLGRWLDEKGIAAHVQAAFESAPLELDPFPHLIVEKWLPDDVYERVIDAMPASIFFASDRDEHWTVPSGVAPLYSRQVWAFVANEIVGSMVYEALNRKFQRVICEYIRSSCPLLPADMDLTLHPSDGRIMLRRPGYNLMPHRDPKWGFVTSIVYLAREGDSEAHGTQLYRVRDDSAAPTSRVYYVEPGNCELVKDVPFRANSMLVFLNSEGAHGASIPADQPETLERYIYQFRLGPTPKAINRLISLMPPEHAAMWAGAKTARAGGY